MGSPGFGASRRLEPGLNTELKLSVQSLEASLKSGEGPAMEVEMQAGKRRRLLLWAIFLLCFAGALQGILVNGLINVVISSIEKRFRIKSSDSGFIANSYDIASFLCLLPVSYMGGRGCGSKPAWIGVGVAIMGLGSLLFSLPHFLTETYSGGEGGLSTLCGAEEKPCSGNITMRSENEGQVGSNSYKYIFMAAQLLHGAGAAPLYTLGVTYIDENVGPASSAFYLGIFYTMAIVGPAIGYSVGGHFLTFHTDFLAEASSDSSSWVGAWWLGFVICGAAFLLVSIPLSWLPAVIPGATQPSGEQVCRSRLTSIVGSRTSSFRVPVHNHQHRRLQQEELGAAGAGPLPVGKDLVAAIISLATNPTFLFLSLSGACEGFLMTGLATFLPKLIQNTYQMSASQAAVHVGAVSVVAGGGGTLLGGFVVRRFGLKVPGLLKMTSVTQFVAVIMATGLMVGCQPVPMVGLEGGLAPPVPCHHCSCDRFDYQPVCGNGVQFYNPCFAGCRALDQGLFTNCSCLPSSPTTSSPSLLLPSTLIATPGPCPASCPLLPIFLASLFLTMFVTFLANMPTLTATLRCVDPNARSLALGIQWLVIRLLGTIPGPVAMGKLFDLACTSWQLSCSGVSDHCVLYNNSRISGNVMTLTGVCKGLSIIAFLAGLRFYKLPVGPDSEERLDADESEKKDKEKEVKEEEKKKDEEKEEKVKEERS